MARAHREIATALCDFSFLVFSSGQQPLPVIVSLKVTGPKIMKGETMDTDVTFHIIHRQDEQLDVTTDTKCRSRSTVQ